MSQENKIIPDLMLSRSQADAIKYMNESVYEKGSQP